MHCSVGLGCEVQLWQSVVPGCSCIPLYCTSSSPYRPLDTSYHLTKSGHDLPPAEHNVRWSVPYHYCDTISSSMAPILTMGPSTGEKVIDGGSRLVVVVVKDMHRYAFPYHPVWVVPRYTYLQLNISSAGLTLSGLPHGAPAHSLSRNV